VIKLLERKEYNKLSMKYLETTFEDYLNSSKNTKIKNVYDKFIEKLPENINELNNLIIYGKRGIGKYTKSIEIIEKYSHSHLKYERKLNITYQKKQTYLTKISDIHYEIDFELLGCNARTLWNELYSQIIDIILSKKEKQGIILCKNFHMIHSELLDIFYSYIQKNNDYLTIKYIILTEQISFLPDNILENFNILGLSKLKLSDINKIKNNKLLNIKSDILDKPNNYNIKKDTNIYNLKNIKLEQDIFENEYKILTNKLIEMVLNVKNERLNFIELRENLYNILIYQIDIYECIWELVYNILNKIKISNELFIEVQIEINKFLKYYNNNYRPIFHLERIVLYLCNIVNECE
jgi:hypothetical protein